MAHSLRVLFALAALFPIVASSACSSSPAPAAPVPSSCTLADGAADCGADFEYVCTGDGEPRVPAYGVVCTAGPVGADGTKSFCCPGCLDQAGDACGAAATGSATSYLCKNAIPGTPSTHCFARTPVDGATPYCCFDESQQGTCRTEPSLECDRGTEGVRCDGNHQPDTSTFSCSTGSSIGRDYAYCCSDGTLCGDTTTPCGSHALGASLFECNGPSAKPAPGDPSRVCGQGVERVNATTHDSVFAFCCAALPAGKCTPDPKVPGCVSDLLFGFSCTGTATPKEQLPALDCFPGKPSANGVTQYCCQG